MDIENGGYWLKKSFQPGQFNVKGRKRPDGDEAG